jgi:hypothetical protein
MLNVSSTTVGIPLIPFNEIVSHRPSGGRYTPQNVNGVYMMALLLGVVATSVRIPPLEIRIHTV